MSELIGASLPRPDAAGKVSGSTRYPADLVKPDMYQLQVVFAHRPHARILAIGDRGRWPGNDYDLLRSPFALSVDEVSVDPQTAWHLGPPGQRGVEVTVGYLRALQLTADGLRITPQGLK